jgi:hypothetical protein
MRSAGDRRSAARQLAQRLAARGRRPVAGEDGRVRVILAKIVYWLAVLVISLALLVALVLFLESRDDSTLGDGASTPSLSFAA